MYVLHLFNGARNEAAQDFPFPICKQRTLSGTIMMLCGDFCFLGALGFLTSCPAPYKYGSADCQTNRQGRDGRERTSRLPTAIDPITELHGFVQVSSRRLRTLAFFEMNSATARLAAAG